MRIKNFWAKHILAIVLTASWALPAAAQTAARWQWLANTYWYVPSADLLALASSPGHAPVAVSDQTVYHILHFDHGYFWGPTAVSYRRPHGTTGSGEPSCLQLVGSVTPEGAVHLTFTPLPAATSGKASGSSGTPTDGVGTMTWRGGEWTMENQMSTAPVGNLLLSHWAYMRQCRRGEACFASLPGVGVSVPEMLEPCTQTAGETK